MTSDSHYNTIEKESIAEFKEKGSKFIAYTFPVSDANDFKKKLTTIKKVHPKATHHCYAYRIGIDGNNFRSSDDGEPFGTAGKPILGQIDSKRLTNILIIVVRYFGGTQLGVSGLINAYKTAASLVLQQAHVIQKPVLIYYRIQFDYTMMNDVMMVIKQFNCSIISQEMDLFCRITIGISQIQLAEVLNSFGKLHKVGLEKI